MQSLTDVTKKTSEGISQFPVGGLVLAALSGVVLGALVRRLFSAQPKGFDEHFTGNFPRYSGATSAVTGGPPEDMNEMPATLDPVKEGPIYDGSQL
jgi:hypothetical protein